MSNSGCSDMSLLEALDLGPISQEVLMNQDDLALLTPNIFQQTHAAIAADADPDAVPNDGMDDVVASAGALFEQWTEEKPVKVKVLGNVVIREADKPKAASKLEKLLTMRRSVTRNKNQFYSSIKQEEAVKPAPVVTKKKKQFRFKVPAIPITLPAFMEEAVVGCSTAGTSSDAKRTPLPITPMGDAGTSTESKDGSVDVRPTSPILGGRHSKNIKKTPTSKGLKRSFEEDEGGVSDIFSQDEDVMMARKFAMKRSVWEKQYRDSVSDVDKLEREMEELKVRLSAAKNIRDRVKKKLDYFKLE